MRHYLRPERPHERAARVLACTWASVVFWWHQARCRHHYDLTHTDCRWYWECRHCHRERALIRRS